MTCQFGAEPLLDEGGEEVDDIFADDDEDLCVIHNSYRSAYDLDRCLWAIQHIGEDD